MGETEIEDARLRRSKSPQREIISDFNQKCIMGRVKPPLELSRVN